MVCAACCVEADRTYIGKVNAFRTISNRTENEAITMECVSVCRMRDVYVCLRRMVELQQAGNTTCTLHTYFVCGYGHGTTQIDRVVNDDAKSTAEMQSHRTREREKEY